VHAAIAAIAGQSNTATAIAVVWQHPGLDLCRESKNKLIFERGVHRARLEYAAYLKAGGSPLLDVTAKYLADGGDADHRCGTDAVAARQSAWATSRLCAASAL